MLIMVAVLAAMMLPGTALSARKPVVIASTVPHVMMVFIWIVPMLDVLAALVLVLHALVQLSAWFALIIHTISTPTIAVCSALSTIPTLLLANTMLQIFSLYLVSMDSIWTSQVLWMFAITVLYLTQPIRTVLMQVGLLVVLLDTIWLIMIVWLALVLELIGLLVTMFLRLLAARVDGMLMLVIVQIALPFLLGRCRLVVAQLFI
jgi:hypothetical protein